MSKLPEPSFSYFLTTRGLNDRGVILSLECTPVWFHQFVTVVSSKENKEAIKEKYPEVKYLSSPDRVNSAALKRKFLFEELPKSHENIVLMNDEMRLSMAVGGKMVPAKSDDVAFANHIARFELLSKQYVGFSAGTRSFNNEAVASGVEISENKLVGAFFTYSRSFANKKLQLARLNYHEDCDYTLQTLSMGYRTGNYLGLLYEGRTHKPRRQFSDRTLEIQERDSKKLLSWFPEAVSPKPDYDVETQDMDLSIRYSKAYAPKRKVLFVCHGNINRSAAAEIILRHLRMPIDVKSCGVKADAGGQITARKTRTALSSLGITTTGIRSQRVSQKLINWADVVFYMDGGNLKRLTEEFPKNADKFFILPSVIGQEKFDDPGFISDPNRVLEITTDILSAVKAWVKDPSLAKSVPVDSSGKPAAATKKEKAPKKVKPLMEGHLSVTQFGKKMLEVNDLDPIYVMLVDSKMPKDQLKRWILAYVCFYHAGVATYCSSATGQKFWERLRKGHDEKWPRGAERRHFRGGTSDYVTSWLPKTYDTPEEAIDFLVGPKKSRKFSEVIARVKTWKYFGPWVAFKIADLIDRVLGVPIDFSDCHLDIYQTPKQGAELVIKLYGKDADMDGVIDRLERVFKNHKAPPFYDRAVNVQEVETILCKWKSHTNGHYPIGKDTHEIREGLKDWGKAANALIKYLPGEH